MRVVRLTMGTIGWLLLVTAVVVGSWFAIDAAGSKAGATDGSVSVITMPASRPTDASPSPGVTPSPTTSATAAPSPRDSQSPSPSESPARGVYNSDAGGLVVRCAGTSVEYWSVKPATGWRAATSQVSDSVLEVASSAAGNRSSVVRATCRAGGPGFVKVDSTPATTSAAPSAHPSPATSPKPSPGAGGRVPVPSPSPSVRH